MYQLSIVIPVRDDNRIFRCIDSFLNMKMVVQAELIVVCNDAPYFFQEKLKHYSKTHSNIQIILTHHLNRRQRRDLGTKQAQSIYICFIDSDCVFDAEYLVHLLPVIASQPILRGKVIYLPQASLFSKGNCIYREIADEHLFKHETFSPNLILHKQVLENVGGWVNDGKSIHYSDDFVLSDSIRRYGYIVQHIDQAVIYHEDDLNAHKTIQTWFGYGLGWGFRYHKNRLIDPNETSFFRYIPPFPYRMSYSFVYFFFAVFHWTVICLGFLVGIFRYVPVHGELPKEH